MMNRREFLRGMTGLAAGAAVGGCEKEPVSEREKVSREVAELDRWIEEMTVLKSFMEENNIPVIALNKSIFYEGNQSLQQALKDTENLKGPKDLDLERLRLEAVSALSRYAPQGESITPERLETAIRAMNKRKEKLLQTTP